MLWHNRQILIAVLLLLLTLPPIILAPIFSARRPTELRSWIGAQPPGFTHPDCFAENHFQIGKIPRLSPQFGAVRELRYQVVNTHLLRYRIVRQENRIKSIMFMRGAKTLPMLDLVRESNSIHELNLDGSLGRSLPKVLLRVRDIPPDNFFLPQQDVVIFVIRQVIGQEKYEVHLDNGMVTAITRDGLPLSQVSLRGETIQEVLADGKPARFRHWLGTDEAGRDLLLRILYGGRISLLIGVSATLVSLIIGVCFGALSGYCGGRVDRVMMTIVDILYTLPFMFMVIILLVWFGRSLVILFLALGAVQWLTMSRIVRGQIMSLKTMEFVMAARVCGATPLQIVFRHLLPNVIGPIIVYTSLTVPIVILEESFLSFLGLTVQYQGDNLDSWGALIKQGMEALGASGAQSWLLIWPSLTMVVTLLGLNLLGDGLRDYLDPKTRKL